MNSATVDMRLAYDRRRPSEAMRGSLLERGLIEEPGRPLAHSAGSIASERTHAQPAVRTSLDVVHRDPRLPSLALDEVGDRHALEDAAGGLGRLAENALLVAAQWAVEELDDVEGRDLGGVTGEAVAALDPALRGEDA